MKSSAKSDLVGKVAQALERAELGRGQPSTNRSKPAEDRQAEGSTGGSILLALSGGPDSVALLHVLRELAPRLGFRLAAAHLNHRLRAAESDRDEAFVRDLCATLGVEVVAEQSSGLDPAAPNLEERAREARYAFLAGVAAQLGASHVATAHHADDQAE